MRITSLVLFIITLTVTATAQNTSIACASQVFVPPNNQFILVIDRSSSMSGEPIRAAQQGAMDFVNGLKADDRCALIVFGSTVEIMSEMSGDKATLIKRIKSIRPAGATALYDAIAKAVGLVANVDASAVIVYLTDGRDTGSKFSLKDLESMNIVENVLIYGLGYGDVEQAKLTALSQATGGTFSYATSANNLINIYRDVLIDYYGTKGSSSEASSKASIRTVPANLAVLIDGKDAGFTPLNIHQMMPGPHTVVITYSKGGKWECSFDAKPNHRVVMVSRESDLGHSLRVASNPKSASIFIDGTYVGITSDKTVSRTKKKLFKPAVVDFSNQVDIPYVTEGKHHMRIIAMADVDFGGSQVFEFDFRMGSIDRTVEIDIYNRISTFTDGETIEGEPADPFEDF